MPIYEYQCQACEVVTDALQKMSDAPLVTCPECAEDALKKLVSAPRFRLAGAGWYETDFKKDNQRNLATTDSDSGAAKKSDKKTSTSEAKKENKATPKSDKKI